MVYGIKRADDRCQDFSSRASIATTKLNCVITHTYRHMRRGALNHKVGVGRMGYVEA